MGRMLRLGRKRVLQVEQCFGDVPRHGDVNVLGRVVPGNRETEVTGTGPVSGTFVFCF